MKRRIFIAISIPAEVKKEVGAWQKKNSRIPVRWIKEDNLHITVIPPWYVADDELHIVMKAVKGDLKYAQPFSVRFEKVLFGPPNQPSRLIWAEGETPKEFIDLKNCLDEALADFIRPEKRRPKLHLTIARFRPGSIHPFPEFNEEIGWEFEVESIVLMESKLRRAGAQYSIIQAFPF